MNNFPIVIVISEGSETPENIISSIRKMSINDEHIILDNSNLIGLKYHLTTKYYETDILFIPFDKPLNTFPHHLQIFVEGLFIYFNANNRDFLKSITNYVQYLESNDIELGILLCHELFDDAEDGITYKEVKQSSKLLDVIELGRTKDEEDAEENSDHHDPIGYDEVLQVLRSFLWSNVQTRGAHNKKNDYKLLDCGEQSSAPVSTVTSEQNIEAELAGFEKLLTEVMMFKSNSSTWSRNERLAYTQNFADAFDDLIGDGSSDEESAAATPD